MFKKKEEKHVCEEKRGKQILLENEIQQAV